MEHLRSWSVHILITVIYWAKKHTHYNEEQKDLLVAVNDVIPDIKADRTKQMFLSLVNIMQDRSQQKWSNSFENMPKLKYLETPLSNDKDIREESKRKCLLPFSQQSFDCPFALYEYKIKIC
jgi:hypothetical protein